MTKTATQATSHQERTRRQGVRRRIMWRAFAINAAGLLLLELYTLIGGGRVERELFAIYMTSGNVPLSLFFVLAPTLIVILAVAYARWRTRRLWRWYLTPDGSTTQPSEAMQRLALNLPVLIARLSLLMWLLLGAISILILVYLIRARLIPVSTNYRDHITLSLGLVGIAAPLTTVLCYFAVEQLWQPEVPLFFAQTERGPHDIARSRMTLRVRLLYTIIMGVFPMVLLAVEAYKQATRIAGGPSPLVRQLLYKEIYLLATWVLLMVSVAMTGGRSFVHVIITLRQYMQSVREGTLNVHMPVTSNDEFGDLALGFNAMVSGLQQEEVIRRLFNLYVTPEVAEHAIVHGAELGGQLTEATVLFSDIRNFTAMTEALGPETILGLLNRYFDAMSGAIIAEGGLVNKFGGDSILAIFGTPLNPATDHATRAARAARDMLKALEDFNTAQIARQEPGVRIGIGIATGTVVAGNVGSSERLEYTVIGDTVNLASRLEGMTKSLPGTILLNEVAAQAIGATLPLAPIGEIEVRGKGNPVPVYTLRDTPRMS